MREAESVFVDTGAWIALALFRDPLHPEARELWERLGSTGARLHTSTHVVVETFTFLDRNAARDVALAWKDSLASVARLTIHTITLADLEQAWSYFQRAFTNFQQSTQRALCS